MADIESALVVRMEASLARFEKQMAQARKSAGDSATGIEKRFDQMSGQMGRYSQRAADGLKLVVNNAAGAERGIARIGQVSGAGRFVLQNTANQLGDIAVQMSSGTSASRALSQQLPQMLGGFGALGGALGVVGPLLGTVAAIGIPVSIALANMGDGAGDLSEQMKELTKATDAYNAAAKATGVSQSDLIGQYGGRADEARRLLEYQKEIAGIRAKRAFGNVASELPGEFAGIGEGITRQEVELAGQILIIEEDLAKAREQEMQQLKDLGRARTDAQTARLRELRRVQGEGLGKIIENSEIIKAIQTIRKEMGVTTIQAAEMAATLAEIQTAGTTEAQSEAMSRFAQQIFNATGGLKNADDETIALYQSLLDAVEAGLSFASIDFSSGVGDAANEAARLAANLARARGARTDAAVGGNVDFFDPRNEAGLSGVITRERGVPRQNLPGYKPPRSGGGGGGGGGGVDKGMQEAQRLFNDTRTAAEKYAEELERINELHRLFPEIVTNEVRDRAVKALNESASQLSDTAKTLESSLEDAFASAVFGAGKAKEAVAALLQQLGRMALHAAFQGLGIGKAFDGLFGGIFKPRAAGGMVQSGQPYMVGEAGPEPFFPKMDGRILSVAQAQSALRSTSGSAASGSVHVSVSMDQNGNLVPLIQRVSGNVAARAVGAGMAAQDRKTASNIKSYTSRRA